MNVLGRTRNTAHHSEAMIVAQQMTALPSGSRRSEIRFGGGSVFGFLKPFRFFDLRVIHSESSTTRFGIGSVSLARQKGHRKSCYASSTFRRDGNECVFLIIPWSKVRVLPGPPIIRFSPHGMNHFMPTRDRGNQPAKQGL